MAFGVKNIYPIDTRPGTAVGVALPFNAPATFFPTYTTKDAIKNNLINFLLTNKRERYLNNDFGADLRTLLFEQIYSENTSKIESTITSLINLYFPMINVLRIQILQTNSNTDNNEISIGIDYSIPNNGVVDNIDLTFIS